MNYTQSGSNGSFGSPAWGETWTQQEPMTFEAWSEIPLTEDEKCREQGMVYDSVLGTCVGESSQLMPWDVGSGFSQSSAEEVQAALEEGTGTVPPSKSPSKKKKRGKSSTSSSQNQPPVQGMATWQKWTLGGVAVAGLAYFFATRGD